MRTTQRGFTIAELLVAIGFFAVAVLTVLGLNLAVVRVDSKAIESAAGSVVADRLIQRTVAKVKADAPAGTRANFWVVDHVSVPWEEGTTRNGGTEFHYTVSAETVLDPAGNPIGQSGAGPNRLEKIDVRVWWFSDDTGSETSRAGYGRLEHKATKLITEAETTPLE